MTAPTVVEGFFRHEYGRLVARLTRRVGVQHFEEVEDAVQHALLTALQTWRIERLPDSPSAWLVRVAYNALIDNIRKQTRQRRLVEHSATEYLSSLEDTSPSITVDETEDDLLRMLFVCCDRAIPPDSQLVLALKTLCGFGVREIGVRLFMSEANVYKRLARARNRLRQNPPRIEEFPARNPERLLAVQTILYILFTEGYLSTNSQAAIRREVCCEAIRLTTLLANHPAGQSPETFALLALMHLNVARLTSRQDETGGLLLLEEQNRSLWDWQDIETGIKWLGKSAQGDVFSRFHAEAGIAAEHCLAPSFQATRWERVVACYALLERSAPSAIHTLNRAVALAEWQGPAAGLALLEGIVPPTWLAGSYQWSAVLSDLNRRLGADEPARRYRELAIRAAPTMAVKTLLERRLGA